MPKFFYAAGERIHAVIAEADNHPRCEFDYEPPTCGQSAEYENRIRDTNDAVKLQRIGFEIVGKHVREWNLVKNDGTAVNRKDAGELNRVPSHLLLKIVTVIQRRTHGDLAAAEPEAAAEAAAEAAVEAERKNS